MQDLMVSENKALIFNFSKMKFKKIHFHDQQGLKFLLILQAVAILEKKAKIFIFIFFNIYFFHVFNSSFF